MNRDDPNRDNPDMADCADCRQATLSGHYCRTCKGVLCADCADQPCARCEDPTCGKHRMLDASGGHFICPSCKKKEGKREVIKR